MIDNRQTLVEEQIMIKNFDQTKIECAHTVYCESEKTRTLNVCFVITLRTDLQHLSISEEMCHVDYRNIYSFHF